MTNHWQQMRTGAQLNSVKTLAMPTCNRVDFARRSLRSFIENSLKFGVECDYVVYDDSASGSVRESYRAMLRGMSQEFGVPVYYAGFEEKVSFLKRLLASGDIPADLAKFALFDVHKHGASTLGGNRNAVLLDNPKRALVTVDDDTFCRMSRMADATDEVEFGCSERFSVSDPCDLVSYADRNQLLTSLTYADSPFLQIHDRVLGRTAAELGGANARAGPHARTGRGKVLVTFNGLAGDCAWAPSASYIYFFVTGASLSRLTSSTAVYESARVSREILRVTRRIVITPGTGSPGAFFGMDNRDLLPPFMPLGGAEDMFYWELKQKCFSDDFFAHLPWALLHQPPGDRLFQPIDIRRPRRGFDFYSMLMAFLRLQPVPDGETIGERLAILGREFERWGSQAPAEFERTVKDVLTEDVTRVRTHLERQLLENTDGCQAWREDLEHFLRESWSSFEDPDVAVPVDFMFLRSREQALGLAKELISQYGRLLQTWPQFVRRTSELRNQGIRLAKLVD